MKKLLWGLLAACMCLAVAATAEAKVVVGGKMLTDVGHHFTSKERNTGGADLGNFLGAVAGYSRLFVLFENAAKNTGAHVEMGYGSHTSAGIGLRHIYAWWKTGRCKLTAGHTDNWFGTAAIAPPQNFGFTPALKWLLIDWGNVWGVRRPQLSFTWQGAGFGYQFGLAQPLHGSDVGFSGGDVYTLLPELWAAVKFSGKSFVLVPGFSFTRYQAEGAGSGDDSVDAWMFNLPAKFSIGAFSVLVGLHYGKNPGLTPAANWVDGAYARPVLKSNGAFEDTENYGGYLTLQYQGSNWRVFGGFGAEKFGNDTRYKEDYCRKAGFLGFIYKVNSNFSINPELGYYDHGDDPETGNNAGSECLAGVQFAFVF